MRRSTLIGFFFLAVPGSVLAQATETRCAYGDLMRRVVVMTEPGVSVPCEVHYFKDTEAPGDDQVLWSATQQAGYCEEKAAGLVAKLEGWGWDCGDGAPPAATPAAPDEAPDPPEPAAAPEAPADTTGDLAPAAEEDGEDRTRPR